MTQTFQRMGLRKWLLLEEARSKIRDKFSKHDHIAAAEAIQAYIELAGGESGLVETNTVLESCEAILATNSLTKDFPIIRSAKETTEPLPWEYEGRSWYFWENLLANHYGWTPELIANLDIDDAVGLYQEIEIEQQLKREWEWGLSEIAYPYDAKTKSSRYHPLERPEWMTFVTSKPKIVKIRKELLPIGNITEDDKLSKTIASG